MPHPRFTAAISGAALVAVLAVAVLRPETSDARFHGTAYLPPEPAPAFELTGHHAAPVSLSDYRGRAVLLFFGFATCPDVCPTTLGRLSRVLEAMEADTARVRVVMITVDPERDTPETLRRFVASFAPYVDGLTGDPAELEALRAAYGVYAGPHPGNPEMALTHTPAVFGIDASGQLRVLLPMDAPDETVAADIRALLRS